METRINATGFEKVFCKSWEGWDLADTCAYIFYKPELTDLFAPSYQDVTEEFEKYV